jgi:hypothetical protein
MNGIKLQVCLDTELFNALRKDAIQNERRISPELRYLIKRGLEKEIIEK